MTDFDDIRPYRDDEVHAVLHRVIAEPEFLSAIARFLFSNQSPFLLNLLKPIIRVALQLRTRRVYSVRAFQEIVESYMAKMIRKTTDGLSVSGLRIFCTATCIALRSRWSGWKNRSLPLSTALREALAATWP